MPVVAPVRKEPSSLDHALRECVDDGGGPAVAHALPRLGVEKKGGREEGCVGEVCVRESVCICVGVSKWV